MKPSSLVFASSAALVLGALGLLGATGCTANTAAEATGDSTDELGTRCTIVFNPQTRRNERRCVTTGGPATGGPTGNPVTTPPATPAPPPAPLTPAGCTELTFGVSDFGPFAPNSTLPVRGESDAEVNIFRSGYIATTLDYGALRRYADPHYCSPYELNCFPTFNRFRTIRIVAGLGNARVIRFALWATSKNFVQYTQVSTIYPGSQANANDVPVGGEGPFTFEMKNILSAAVITGIALDETRNYMLTAYIPDASQRDIYRNQVCDLRFDVLGKSFGN